MAPPRVSPSSFVKMAPVIFTLAWKASATLTASWPVVESRTRKDSCGLTAL